MRVKLLIIVTGLAALPWIAGSASASSMLSDPQLDGVTAGQILGVTCCGTENTSTSTSMNGGAPVTTFSSLVIGGNNGNNGSTGGNNGSTGGNNGSTGGNNGSPPGFSVTTPVQPPPGATAIINTVSTPSIGGP